MNDSTDCLGFRLLFLNFLIVYYQINLSPVIHIYSLFSVKTTIVTPPSLTDLLKAARIRCSKPLKIPSQPYSPFKFFFYLYFLFKSHDSGKSSNLAWREHTHGIYRSHLCPHPCLIPGNPQTLPHEQWSQPCIYMKCWEAFSLDHIHPHLNLLMGLWIVLIHVVIYGTEEYTLIIMFKKNVTCNEN